MFFDKTSEIYFISGISSALSCSLLPPLSQLKACLGMQVVACVASVINLIFSVSDLAGHGYGNGCWVYVEINSTDHNDTCYSITVSMYRQYVSMCLKYFNVNRH